MYLVTRSHYIYDTLATKFIEKDLTAYSLERSVQSFMHCSMYSLVGSSSTEDILLKQEPDRKLTFPARWHQNNR